MIEDETPVANFLHDYLTGRGCRVVVAADGQAGLEAFHAEKPDLVACDLLLPRRNGFRIVEDLRELSPRTPVVVMTGVYKSASYRAEVAHARLFLHKPLQVADLEAMLELIARPEATPERETEAAAPPPRSPREPWVSTRLVPLPRMLHLLWRDKRTGLLTHRLGERRTVFVLESGQLRFVRCNELALRLESVLLQVGAVSPAEVERAKLELGSRTTPARLGEVLVEQGMLTRDDVARLVQVQLRRIVARAFADAGGETLFRPETEPSDEDVVIDADVRALIVSGCVAWRDDEDRLSGHLPDGTCPLALSEDADDPALKLPATVRHLVAAVREPTSTARIIAMADLIGLHGRPTVFGLLCAGVLVPAREASWIPSGSEPEPSVSEIPRPAVAPEVLLRLEEERATGVLRIVSGEQSAWLQLVGGAIAAAGSSDQASRLGQRLQAAGLLAPEQLELALQIQAQKPDAPLGRILVERGLLDGRQLLHALRAQVLSIAKDVLTWLEWDQASFEVSAVEAEPLLGVSTSNVVLEALKSYGVRRLQKLIGATAPGRPRLRAERLTDGRFALTDTEEAIARALGADTDQLIQAIARGQRCDADVLRIALLALLVSPAEDAVAASGATRTAEDVAPLA